MIPAKFLSKIGIHELEIEGVKVKASHVTDNIAVIDHKINQLRASLSIYAEACCGASLGFYAEAEVGSSKVGMVFSSAAGGYLRVDYSARAVVDEEIKCVIHEAYTYYAIGNKLNML
ncbi:hypothetical protein ACOSQ4_008909 [Xanthoceras sorbifolium]